MKRLIEWLRIKFIGDINCEEFDIELKRKQTVSFIKYVMILIIADLLAIYSFVVIILWNIYK